MEAAIRQTAAMPTGRSSFVFDTWVALLAGSGPWRSSDDQHRAWIGVLTSVEVAALVGASFGALRVTSPSDHSWGVPVSVAAPLLAALHVLWRLRARVPARIWPSVVSRVLLLAAFTIGLLSTGQQWGLLWSSFVSLAMGIDLALTCLALGWEAAPRAWYRRFLTSGFHWGVTAATATFILVRGTKSFHVVLPAYITMHLWVGGAMGTLWLISSLYWRDVAERAAAIEAVIDAERRARAHWLHDNVCADLRLVSMKVETSDLSRRAILGLLDQFDHQIRLRQLEELMATGEVSVAELLQPYIRRCQAHGADVAGLPTFETASIALSTEPARLLARAAANLTSNALNAGATQVGFSIDCDGPMLTLRVDDNAPTTTSPQLVPGRGLWKLREDLRPGDVQFGPGNSRGHFVIVTIPLHPKRQRDG